MQSRRLFLIGGLLALGLSSCGDGRKPTFPVSGKVVLGDKPVANATVVFHPAGGDANELRPRATTQADGTFRLTTYDGNDGAPAGEYRVTVELWLSSGRGDEGPTSRLPAKFARPETSGLAATVAAGPNELKPFGIKR
ncbi:MAG: carboxypeptidase-like regulatory domain-containing protein [Gemmataceae bacterium]